MSKHTNAAYERGYAAYLAGKSELDNPFDVDSDDAGYWLDGYNQAAENNDPDTNPEDH